MQTMEKIVPVMSRAVLIIVLLLAPAFCAAGPLVLCSDHTQGNFDDTNLAGTWRVVYGPAELRDEVHASKLVNFTRVTPENVDDFKKTIPNRSIAWEKVKHMFQVPNSSVNFPMETNEHGRYSAFERVMQLNNLGDYLTIQLCDHSHILLLHKGQPSRADIQRVAAANNIDGVFMD